MRVRLQPTVLVLWILAWAPQACLDDDSGDIGADQEDITIVVEADKSQIQDKANDLRVKRNELSQEQEDLRKQKQELRKRLTKLSAKDKKQRAKLESEEQRIDQQEKELLDRRRNLENKRELLDKQRNDLLNRITQLTARKGGLTIARREQLIASREKDVGRREAGLTKREGKIAKREKLVTEQLAKLVTLMEELKNAAKGMGKTVVKAASGGGDRGAATRKGARRYYNRVRASMKKRGILEHDLSERGRGLIGQYQVAYKEGDFEAALDAVDRLNGMINGISINAAFIQHKFNRINALAAGKKMGAAVERLLSDVTSAFTNGNYSAANAKLNMIYSKLKRR